MSYTNIQLKEMIKEAIRQECYGTAKQYIELLEQNNGEKKQLNQEK